MTKEEIEKRARELVKNTINYVEQNWPADEDIHWDRSYTWKCFEDAISSFGYDIIKTGLGYKSDEELKRIAEKHATKNVFRSVNGGEFIPDGTRVDPDMRDSFVAGYRAAQASKPVWPSEDEARRAIVERNTLLGHIGTNDMKLALEWIISHHQWVSYEEIEKALNEHCQTAEFWSKESFIAGIAFIKSKLESGGNTPHKTGE